jgi:hypothetical protein
MIIEVAMATVSGAEASFLLYPYPLSCVCHLTVFCDPLLLLQPQRNVIKYFEKHDELPDFKLPTRPFSKVDMLRTTEPGVAQGIDGTEDEEGDDWTSEADEAVDALMHLAAESGEPAKASDGEGGDDGSDSESGSDPAMASSP